MNANARGVSLAKPPSTAPDEPMQVMGALGLPFFGMGIYVWIETHSRLSFMPLGLGAVLLFGALVRLATRTKQKHRPPKIEILVIEPRFVDKTVLDDDGAERNYKYLRDTSGRDAREWQIPSKLHPLLATLKNGERLRVGLVTRNAVEYLAWAYPL